MLVVQNPTAPSKIRDAIIDLIPEGTVALHVAAAYTTLAGSRILMDLLAHSVGDAVWSAMPKILVTSFDFGVTEPYALSHWLSLENTSVRIAATGAIGDASGPSTAFHPKIYAFRLDNQTYNLLVASANLTARGFTVNTEVGWSQRGVPVPQVDAAFSRLRQGTQPLSNDLLAAYVERRKARQPTPISSLEAQPVTPFVPSGRLPSLSEIVEAGQIDLATCDAMWVQVEALQGGSQNQLELPRLGHRFFGFSFTQYDYPHNLMIGLPKLREGMHRWTDRPLTWHGNNRMERINLPTRTQGGPDYSDSVVRFRRLSEHWFELAVTPLNSDLANAWKNASSESGKLFRLGTQATTRLVGLL